MFQRWRNTVTRFMTGRYGLDSLGWFLLIVYGVLCVVGWFFPARSVPLRILGGIALVVLVLCFGRVFSRRIGQRQAENERYLRCRNAERSCDCPFAGDGGRSPVPAATVSSARCFFKWRSSPPAANKHRCSIAFSFPLPPTTINAGAVLRFLSLPHLRQ